MLVSFVCSEVNWFKDMSEKEHVWLENSFNSLEVRNLPSYSSMRLTLSAVLDKVKARVTTSALCLKSSTSLTASLHVEISKY